MSLDDLDDDSLLYPLPKRWRDVVAGDAELAAAVAWALQAGSALGAQREVREAIIAWYRAVRLRPGEPWEDVAKRTLGKEPKR